MIHLDHDATTPVLPEVCAAMLPFLGEDWDNPSSTCRFGSQLKLRVEEAREHVAELSGAKASREILFTSGSACLAGSPDPSHVIAAMKPGSAARQCLRWSLGAEHSHDDITRVLGKLQRLATTLRG